MPISTFYLLDTLAANSSHLALQEGGVPPATATLTTGWTVGQATAGEMSSMAAQVERARITFTATAQPSGAPSGVIGDCFRTPSRLRGDFLAGNFVCAFPVIAVSSGNNQDGRIRLRLWRSRFPDGALAHEITGSTLLGTVVTNLATSLQQISTVTLTLPAFALAREFLFFQIAWEITGAGSTITRDVLLRSGLDAQITTPDLNLTTTYDLWTQEQLNDDLAEWLADRDSIRSSFLTTNNALLTDPQNATLLSNYSTQQADMRSRKIEILRIIAEFLQRDGELLADIGAP